MFYLFTQTFFWLASAFIAGFVIGWWLRGKTDGTDQQKELIEASQAEVPPAVEVVSSNSKQYSTPDSWAPDGLVSSPVDGKDDLKPIKGIGPKREERLNNLGIYTYSQLASLNSNNIAWLRDRLKSTRKLPIEEWVTLAGEKLAAKKTKRKK